VAVSAGGAVAGDAQATRTITTMAAGQRLPGCMSKAYNPDSVERPALLYDGCRTARRIRFPSAGVMTAWQLPS
jgi:hypothetical protein